MRKVLIIVVLISFFACDEVIQLDPGQTDQRIVIDALLTDNPSVNYVRITRNVDFYFEGPLPGVDGATVSIIDDLGANTDYTLYTTTNPDSSGYYLPPSGFVGQIGRAYTLDVTVSGVTYSATETMFRNFQLDSLSVRMDPNPWPDEIEEDRLYQVLFYGFEPQDAKDYYFFDFYDGDSLLREQTQIFISDDTFLAGQVSGLEFPFNYTLGDSATIRVSSISRSVYLYYSDLINILANDGMFSPPPSNPESNLSNGALGVFQVSSVNQLSIMVQE